ncbi:unnamed protein product [Heligmosomoides polygyrus]|uniref:Uncharacterized protein n=1 Tax=Heligmosomoides polygyrus TaxID=6339 RepID=A0A3P8EUB4_HELPZ|nr:unnamed protein product [Heligmosomoides polygyrus]
MAGSQQLTFKLSYNMNSTADPSTNGDPANRRLPSTGAEFFLTSTTSVINNQMYCNAVLNITGASEAGLLRVLNSSYIAFELVAPGTTGAGVYVAVAFSEDDTLAYTQSIECSSIGMEPLSMKFSYYDRNGKNVRIKGEEGIHDQYFLNEVAVFQDGNVYCSAEVNVQGSTISKEGKDYVIECSALVNEGYTWKFSYNNATPANVRIAGEENIRDSYFGMVTIRAADSQLYCSAVVNVFRLNPNQPYNILLANGNTDSNGLTVHEHSVVSSSRLISYNNDVKVVVSCVFKFLRNLCTHKERFPTQNIIRQRYMWKDKGLLHSR